VAGNGRRQAPATEGEGSRGVPHGDERARPWRRSGSAAAASGSAAQAHVDDDTIDVQAIH
jgi:hypothetical protein